MAKPLDPTPVDAVSLAIYVHVASHNGVSQKRVNGIIEQVRAGGVTGAEREAARTVLSRYRNDADNCDLHVEHLTANRDALRGTRGTFDIHTVISDDVQLARETARKARRRAETAQRVYDGLGQ